MMPKLQSVKHYICVDGPSDKEKGNINYRELVSRYEPKEHLVEAKPDDLIALYMSGGTTGVPKAAM